MKANTSAMMSPAAGVPIVARSGGAAPCAAGCSASGAQPAAAPLGYPVPNETLTSIADGRALGMHDANDLYGGVVPYPFVATKTITHSLVGTDAAAPEGWRGEFAESVVDVVLPGRLACSAEAARTGGRRLLQDGPRCG